MKKYLFLSLMILSVGHLFAQQDPMYSQYMFNMLSVNPGYAGSREVLSLTALGRKQWAGIDGAPTTFTFSADMPIKNKKIGLGVNFVNDKLGIMSNTAVNLMYAYRLRISKKGMLGMGLQGGFNQYQAAYGSVDPSQNSSYNPDPAFSSNISRFLPNIGAGLWYSTDKFYAGLSVPKLLRNKLDDMGGAANDLAYQNRQNLHYFITTGYVFTLSDVLKLKPSALVKIVHGSPVQLDLNANLWIHDVVGVGLSYRSGDSIDAMLEFQINPQLRIGYAYDYTLTKLGQYNSGSHELMIRYEFGFDKGKILSPRYF